jgi:hypothetical protein
MIRLLEEANYNRYRIGDVVKCGHNDWYIVDIKDDVATLLLKRDYYGHELPFDDPTHKKNFSNSYAKSTIRQWLRDFYLEDVQWGDVEPLETYLSDVGCKDKIYLLSTKEAKRIPKNLRKFSEAWFLRTPGTNKLETTVAYVDTDGEIQEFGDEVYWSHPIHPAMRVHIEDLD